MHCLIEDPLNYASRWHLLWAGAIETTWAEVNWCVSEFGLLTQHVDEYFWREQYSPQEQLSVNLPQQEEGEDQEPGPRAGSAGAAEQTSVWTPTGSPQRGAATRSTMLPLLQAADTWKQLTHSVPQHHQANWALSSSSLTMTTFQHFPKNKKWDTLQQIFYVFGDTKQNTQKKGTNFNLSSSPLQKKIFSLHF